MEDATTLALGRATPHAVLETVKERVFETLGHDRALGAHALGALDTGTVRGEEPTPVDIATPPLKHPRVLITVLFHDQLLEALSAS